jgi:nucleoside-diphosphate-sugar epimerase
MERILITGCNGFIGQHLKNYLSKKEYLIEAPTSTALNVILKDDWDKWKEKNIYHVVHLAGKTFVPDSWENPEEFFQTNIMGTMQAIRYCREQHIGMTYISAYIYGQPKSNPIPEGADINPNNPYAKSKYMAEELCKFFCKYFDMNITVLRLFNVYGTGQKEQFLIPYIVTQALDSGDAITVQDLEPKRDYVHIDDVCHAIELSVQNTCGYHIFNIGSGKSYSVQEVIDKVQMEAHTEKKVISQNNIRRNELNDVIADISSIKKEWGWEPQVILAEGLKQCVEDMR